MRIAFVLGEARIDGTIRFVARQVRQLRERGHDVAVICAPGVLQHEFDLATVTLIDALSPRSRLVDATDLIRLRQACASYDLIVAVAGRAFPAVSAAVHGSRIVLDLLSNDLFVGDTPEVIEAVQCAAEEGRVVAHALSDARAHSERYGFSPHDVRFVALPVERSIANVTFDRSQFARPDEQIVLSAARLDDDHAAYFPPLFEGMSTLRERGYPVRLLVVGGGTHADALASIAPPSVTFLNFRTDLDALYPLADVYVGEGSSRLEAALAGVPVVSSCAQEYPAHASQALLLFGMQHGTLHAYTPSTAIPPTPFADAIALLMDDAALTRRVAIRGRQRVEREHAPDTYVSFLERLVSGEKPPRGADALTPPAQVLRVRSEPGDLIAASRSAAVDPGIAIVVEDTLSWRSYADLPEDVWDPLADATRRTVLHSGAHSAKPSPLFP